MYWMATPQRNTEMSSEWIQVAAASQGAGQLAYADLGCHPGHPRRRNHQSIWVKGVLIWVTTPNTSMSTVICLEYPY